MRGRSAMRRVLFRWAATVGVGVLLGCGEGPGEPLLEPLTQSLAARLAPRVAFVGFAVAEGSQGASFLDNFLPCVRRGVINYVNTDTGRGVTFSGCDVGNGIVIEGSGDVNWVGPGLANQRQDFCQYGFPVTCLTAFRLEGSFTVSIDGERVVRIETLAVRELEIVSGPGEADVRAVAASVTVETFDVQVADANVYEDMFDTSGMTIETIANGSRSLATLSDADLDRLAYHGALVFAGFLINEISELRPDHTHQLDCGTSAVIFDQNQLPLIVNDWNACEDNGLFFSGAFQFEFGELDLQSSTPNFRVDISGALTIGGGLPTIAVSAWRWGIVFPSTLPGTMRITMVLEGSGGSRTITRSVTVDD
ncbi:MAG: hypothetical protein OER90_13070 [Gemmatimonadota bacterium]|nr:hypothetical protein [Gemmatimonadota bacterium]